MKKENKIKVAFFIPSLCGGGAERMMINFANGFAERGFSVDLLLAQREGEYFSEVGEEVRVLDLKAKRVLFSLFPLIKYLRNVQPESLIVSIDHSILIGILAKILSHTRTKVVVRLANTLSVSLKGTKWHRRVIRRYAPRVFYRFADKLVANSEGSADDLSKTLKIKRERINVIYNPTITPSIFEKARKSSGHLWLDEKEVSVILSVGRLHKQKDFLTLLKAFALCRKSMPLRLVVLGEGEERESLETLAKDLGVSDDIDMPGFVKNPYAYMAKADLFVLSSQWEGLPNVLIEAMALGVPVISTDCPSGPREILEDGKYGKLVPVGDVERLAEAMTGLLQEKLDTKETIASVKARFSIERAIDEYEDIIKR